MSDFNSILKDLRAGKYAPVYFLMGEEPFYIDQLCDHIEKKILDETEREFNLTVLYGLDTDLGRILGEAKKFPMMGERTVVIIKEAQQLKSLSRTEKGEVEEKEDDKKKASAALAPFLHYIENPQKSTILVFCFKYKNLDKRSVVYKTLVKKAVVFESKKIYEDRVPAWIADYIKGKGFTITVKAAMLLTEFLGNDLAKVSNELDKLIISLGAPCEINPDHVQLYVGISKEYNPFELNNALSAKDILKANRIVNHFAANPKSGPLVMVVATLFGHFNKLLTYHALPDKSREKVAASLKVHPFFVRDYEIAAKNYPTTKVESILGYLKEYDLRSKGFDAGMTEDGELMKELVFKILH